MNTSHARFLIVCSLLIILGFFSYLYEPADYGTTKNSLSLLTIDIDGWQFLEDIPLNPVKYTGLNPDALIFKNYINKNNRIINLVVVYHKNNRWGAHNPKVCYTAQGWEIIKDVTTKTISIDNKDFRINHFIVKKGTKTAVVYYYWFSSNKRLTASRNIQMIDMVKNGIIHGYSESGFVRVSMENRSTGGNTTSDIEDFIAKFTIKLKKVL